MPRVNRRIAGLGPLLLLVLLLVAAGPAVLTAAAFQESGRAAVVPWSGWWWPKQAGELVWGYNGRPSPVDKYDLYVTGAYPGPAFYAAADGQWYDPDAESWQGFCNGWVNASILEAEPAGDSVLNGILLRVGDKKGLLTACHASDTIQYLNCKKNPAAFHRYLLEYIGEKKQPVAADLDSTEEFWSYPIYAYEMDISTGADKDTVSCTIHYASDFVDYDFVGTEKMRHTYTYTLDKDAEGDYIGTGTWQEGKVHPEWVWVPVGINQSALFVDFDKVAVMAHSTGGDFQGDDLVPGHHVLLVKPGEPRILVVRPRSGESISCRLALDCQAEYGESGECRLLEDGHEMTRFTLTKELSDKLVIAGSSGPQAEYQLLISPGADNRQDLPVHLLVDVESRFTAWHYGIPSSDAYWLGCGVAPPGDESGRAWLEVVDEQGMPVGRGAVSDLQAGQSWLAVVDNAFPVDYNFHTGKPAGVKLAADFDQLGLFLAGDSATLRGSPLPGPVRNPERRLAAIPWLVSASDMLRQGTFTLHNLSGSTVNADIQYFKKDGTPGTTYRELKLAAGGIETFRKGQYPGQAGIDGWALVRADGELGGTVESLYRHGTADALPLLGLGRSWMAPHVAVSDGWNTVIGICNPVPDSLAVTITAIVDGQAAGRPYIWQIAPRAEVELILNGELFGLAAAELDRAWLKLESSSDCAGYLQLRYLDEARAAVPLQEVAEAGADRRILTPMAVNDGWWTGVVLVNVAGEARNIRVAVLDAPGNRLADRELEIGPRGRVVVSLADLFPGVDPARVASLELNDAAGIRALTLFGGIYGTQYLAAECW